jgi:hypothetical protein
LWQRDHPENLTHNQMISQFRRDFGSPWSTGIIDFRGLAATVVGPAIALPRCRVRNMKTIIVLFLVLLTGLPAAVADPNQRQVRAARGPQRSAQYYQQKADVQKRQLTRRLVRAQRHPAATNEAAVRVTQLKVAAFELQAKAATVAAGEPAKSQALWGKARGLRVSAEAMLSSLANGEEPLRFRSAAFATANNRGAVSEGLFERISHRPLLQVKTGTDAVERYMADFAKNDTIEVIYSPSESQPGHLYVRAGDQLYDFGGPRSADHQPAAQGLRNGRGERYGFVFKSNPQEVAQLQETFAQKVLRARSGELRFAMQGEGGENCTIFINSEIARIAPRLGFRADAIDAISTSRWMLSKNPYLESVVVYSSADSCPSSGDAFTFKKLEERPGE